MTARSLILGLFGAAVLAAFTYASDLFMRGSFLVGNFFPIAVVGALVLFTLAINPLLRALSPRLALSRAETAVVFGLLLFASYVPGRGLGHNFTNLLMLPHHHERIRPDWQPQEVAVTEADVADWAALGRAMASEEAPAGLRDALGPAFRARRAEGVAPEAGERETMRRALNEAIDRGEMVPSRPPSELSTPMRTLLAIPEGRRNEMQRSRLARAAIEEAFDGLIATRHAGVLELVPPRMLADPSAEPGEALDGFVMGLEDAERPIGFADIPWTAWRRTLAFWLPLILTFALASVGLALVVHRQWAEHEHLPYPTMEFARRLLPEADGRAADMLRRWPFWIALAIVGGIHLVNYLHRWWPAYFVPVQLTFDFGPLMEIVPVMQRGSGAWSAFHPRVYFTIVGLAYFLAKDVSLSLGLAPYLFALVSGVAVGYGVSFGGGRGQPHIESFINSGAFLGLFLMLAYSGREHFRSAFARGLGLPVRGRIDDGAVWGARAAMLGIVLLVVQIAALGIEWWMALLYTFWLLLVPLVLARMLAESGVYFLNPRTYPCAMLWGFLGSASLGRQPLMVFALMTAALLISAMLSLLPFAVSALRITDESGVRIGRVAVWGLLAVALGVGVMVPFNLRLQYRHGAMTAGDGWTTQAVPRFGPDNVAVVSRQLEAQGAVEASDRMRGWERIAQASPRRPSVIAFGTALALVLLFSYARHRFANWPLHPVLFAVMAVWPTSMVGFSFLLGWLVKSFVMRYCGARIYQGVKPVMLGLVAGEVIGALVPVIVGLIHYAVHGSPAPSYVVIPG